MDQQKIWSYYQSKAPETFRGSAFRLNFLTRYICSAQKVLNIGIGGGLFEHFAHQKGAYVFSLDPDWMSLRTHIAENNSIHTAGKLENLPFADNSFDAVVVSEVIEHLSPKITLDALQEVRRVLVPGGRIIGTVPCDENLADATVVCPKCGEIFHKVGHLQSFTQGNMSLLLNNFFISIQCFERAFMAKATIGWKEIIIDFIRNYLVRIGVLTREKHLVFLAYKQS